MQVLATMSRRKLGVKLHSAVLNTMTALSIDPKSGRTQVGEAIDRVFDKVLSTAFVDKNLIDIDDFI